MQPKSRDVADLELVSPANPVMPILDRRPSLDVRAAVGSELGECHGEDPTRPADHREHLVLALRFACHPHDDYSLAPSQW